MTATITYRDSDPTAEAGLPVDATVDTQGLPPGLGRNVLPHFVTFSAIVNSVSRTYRYTFDEALKHNRDNALAINRDLTVIKALRARVVPTTQLSWHIEVDDDTDPEQARAQDECTKFINKIPRFQDLKYSLLYNSILIGRSGAQVIYEWDFSSGRRNLKVRDHIPINGDKLVFTFGGEAGILVHGTFQGTARYTDRGRAHFFDPTEREAIVIHKYQPTDVDYYESEMGGSIHGRGIRNDIYWMWYLRSQVISWLLDYLERVGAGGFTVYYYDAGNPASLAEVKTAAQQQFRSNSILFPRPISGTGKQGAGVERIEANNNGSQLLIELATKYFDDMITGYIKGLDIDNEEGLKIGTGESDLRGEALGRVTKYDAVGLQETLTEQLINIKVKYDYPNLVGKVRFVFDVDKPNAAEFLAAAKDFYEMGGDIDADELRGVLGLSKPEPGHAILSKVPQMQPAAVNAMPGGVPVAGAPGPGGVGQPAPAPANPQGGNIL